MTMKKTFKSEGNGATQLIGMIKQFGYNTDVKFEVGVVTSQAPNLKIKLEETPSVILDMESLIVAEHLTKHHVTAKITMSSPSVSMSSAGDPSHTHSVSSIVGTNADILYEDRLKVGKRCILVSADEDSTFYVIDLVADFSAQND